MGRRAAELVGVLVASIITSYVTGLATAGPGEPALYLVGAVVPLALLLAYWLWIEPRAAAGQIRSKRLAQAVEDAFDLSHPETDAPRDAQRRAFYDRLEISDLFEANHIEASTVLAEALDAGQDLRRRLETEDPDALRVDLADWEDRTSRQIEAGRGSGQALGFRYVFRTDSDRAAQIEQIDAQLVMLANWVRDERTRAGEQARDRFR
jgi:hypothetical protein